MKDKKALKDPAFTAHSESFEKVSRDLAAAAARVEGLGKLADRFYTHIAAAVCSELNGLFGTEDGFSVSDAVLSPDCLASDLDLGMRISKRIGPDALDAAGRRLEAGNWDSMSNLEKVEYVSEAARWKIDKKVYKITQAYCTFMDMHYDLRFSVREPGGGSGGILEFYFVADMAESVAAGLVKALKINRDYLEDFLYDVLKSKE